MYYVHCWNEYQLFVRALAKHIKTRLWARFCMHVSQRVEINFYQQRTHTSLLCQNVMKRAETCVSPAVLNCVPCHIRYLLLPFGLHGIRRLLFVC